MSSVAVLWRDANGLGAKGILEVLKADLPHQSFVGAHVSDLIGALNDKIRGHQVDGNKFREVESILLYGTRVSVDRPLDAILLDSPVCNPRLVATMRLRTKDGRPMEIVVETMTGKTIHIACTADDTIAYIKHKIQDSDNISPENQKLVFGGKNLTDHRTLSFYSIQNESVVYVLPKLRGGWTPSRIFADVSDNSILVSKDFADDAPEWLVASRGLNIEGRCKNRECAANTKMIIHPVGYHDFNLLRDGTVPCPSCDLPVKPITCGFYDCFWRFEGMRTKDGYLIASPWSDAKGEKYYRFKADETHGCVEWDNLLIVAKSRSDATAAKLVVPTGIRASDASESETCAFCWSKFGALPKRTTTTIRCGHTLHRNCITKWSQWCKSHRGLPKCPVCLKAVSY